MTQSITRQVLALGLALIATVAMLSSVDLLATQPYMQDHLAQQQDPAVQTVVVVAKRAAHS